MSDPGDSGEPDDVTLWAGRLRPWPEAARTEGQAAEPDDETRIVRRRGTDPDDSVDGATQLVRRRQPALPPVDDDTRVVRRRGSEVDAPAESPDDATQRVRRRPGTAAPGARPAAAPDAEPADEATALVRRARPDAPAPHPVPVEQTELRPTTRREASPRIAAPAHTERSARVPTGEAREIYKPRAVEPVIAERRPPTVAAPTDPSVPRDVPDPAATARRARARRARVLVIGAVVLLAVAAAVVAIIVLAVLPAGA